MLRLKGNLNGRSSSFYAAYKKFRFNESVTPSWKEIYITLKKL